jgi:hypothetical protein
VLLHGIAREGGGMDPVGIRHLQREALLLVGVEGLTYEAAAVVIGCPPGTVKSRVPSSFSDVPELLGEPVAGAADAALHGAGGTADDHGGRPGARARLRRSSGTPETGVPIGAPHPDPPPAGVPRCRGDSR